MPTAALPEQLDVLLPEPGDEACQAGHIPARAGEARDQSFADRISINRHDDGDRGRGLTRRSRLAHRGRHNDMHASAHEIAGEVSEAVGLAGCERKLHNEVASLDVVSSRIAPRKTSHHTGPES